MMAELFVYLGSFLRPAGTEQVQDPCPGRAPGAAWDRPLGVRGRRRWGSRSLSPPQTVRARA